MRMMQKLGVAAVVMGMVSVGMADPANDTNPWPAYRVSGVAAEKMLDAAADAAVQQMFPFFGSRHRLLDDFFVSGDSLYRIVGIRMRAPVPPGANQKSVSVSQREKYVFVINDPEGIRRIYGTLFAASPDFNRLQLSGDGSMVETPLAAVGRIDGKNAAVFPVPMTAANFIVSRIADPGTIKIEKNGALTVNSRVKWSKVGFHSGRNKRELWLVDSGKTTILSAHEPIRPLRVAFDPKLNSFCLVRILTATEYNRLVSNGKKFTQSKAGSVK